MSFLTPPRDGQKTPFVTLAYFRQRQRNRLFDLVHAEFRKSGLTQAELARRMGRRSEVVCRMLGARQLAAGHGQRPVVRHFRRRGGVHHALPNGRKRA